MQSGLIGLYENKRINLFKLRFGYHGRDTIALNDAYAASAGRVSPMFVLPI